MTDDSRRAEIAKESAVEVAAATIGLAVAGPWGAIAGAAVRPLLSVIAQGDDRQRRNIIHLGEAIRELTGLAEDEFAAWASDRDGRLMLVTAAVRAAHNTFLDRKIRGLARLVAEAVKDDALLDINQLIISALSELESPHVRVLVAVCRENRPPAAEPVADGAWLLSQLRAHMPNLAAGMLPITAKLTQLGILNNAGLWAAEGDPVWTVTPFAEQCLAYLEGGAS